MSITHIVKRTGKRVLFNENKITRAIVKSMEVVEEGSESEAEKITAIVIKKLEKDFPETTPTIEDVQDRVEKALIESKHLDAAKEYILYRSERAKLREQKAALIGGQIDEVELSLNSLKLLEQRYLQRDETGEILEKPSELFWRVANHAAMAEIKYKEDPKAAARTFYRLMSKLEFLPASPTLMNAGTDLQLAPCFVVPIPDNIEGIFTALKQAAMIHKHGGGTGFSFSRIRPRSSVAEGMPGVAAGPLAYMKVFETAMRAVKQSGRRSGANMAVLRVDHPDILDFINLKLTRTMTNFNTSVGITDAFMEALKENKEYSLYNPKTKKTAGKLSARVVFDSILTVAWRCGDPGLVFLDRMNAANPCKHLEEIETTSACGEQPLAPYESCVEGSVNLTSCLKRLEEGYEFDYQKLRRIVRQCVQFLDNLIDVNNYPVKEVEKATLRTRKIGLGIMGFADILYALEIPYDSEDAEEFVDKLMTTIRSEAEKTSEETAERRGTFPAWRKSDLEKQGKKLRNATVLGIAPTGTTSLIAGASSGIEPNYALAYSRTVSGGADLLYLNPFFKKILEDKGVDRETIQRIAKRGAIDEEDELPAECMRIFVTAPQISPEWHIRIQSAFQKHVDGAISKTINFPSTASVKEIENGMMLAWELGCKGITVYRDTSLDTQVITAGS